MGGHGSGRRAKPTALHALRGNPSKKRLNEREPKFSADDIAEPPDWLTEGAQAEWLRLGPSLIAQGVLTRADLGAFIGYCEAFAQVEEATKRLKAEGYTVKSKEGGDRSNSWVRIRNQGLDQLRRWAAAFGLDPSMRSKIVAPVVVENDYTRWKERYGKP